MRSLHFIWEVVDRQGQEAIYTWKLDTIPQSASTSKTVRSNSCACIVPGKKACVTFNSFIFDVRILEVKMYKLFSSRQFNINPYM